ncbi:hypothetical protein BDP67DRAFT_530016, partial [Colletotrichum lupini]
MVVVWLTPWVSPLVYSAYLYGRCVPANHVVAPRPKPVTGCRKSITQPPKESATTPKGLGEKMNCSSFCRWLHSHWSLPRFFIKALNSFNGFRLMCIMYRQRQGHSNVRMAGGGSSAVNRSTILFFLSLPPPWQLLSDHIAHALAVRALHIGRAWCGRPYIRKFPEGDMICQGSTPADFVMLIHFVAGELNGIVYLCGIFAKWELSRTDRFAAATPMVLLHERGRKRTFADHSFQKNVVCRSLSFSPHCTRSTKPRCISSAHPAARSSMSIRQQPATGRREIKRAIALRSCPSLALTCESLFFFFFFPSKRKTAQ